MFESNWKREAKNDRLKQGERAGQLAGVILSIIVFIFLLVHWADDTGFYSSEFNEMDATVLFGPLLFGMVPSAFRFLVGRKNPSRPLDVVVSVLFVISAIYFLNYFHFNMEFFADPLPGRRDVLRRMDSPDLRQGQGDPGEEGPVARPRSLRVRSSISANAIRLVAIP